MRNQYKGTCFECGKPCAAGAGLASKSRLGRWRVRHVTCTDAGKVTVAATALAPAKRPKYRSGRQFCGLNPW